MLFFDVRGRGDLAVGLAVGVIEVLGRIPRMSGLPSKALSAGPPPGSPRRRADGLESRLE